MPDAPRRHRNDNDVDSSPSAQNDGEKKAQNDGEKKAQNDGEKKA